MTVLGALWVKLVRNWLVITADRCKIPLPDCTQ
jgi:hypothetical protein